MPYTTQHKNIPHAFVVQNDKDEIIFRVEWKTSSTIYHLLNKIAKEKGHWDGNEIYYFNSLQSFIEVADFLSKNLTCRYVEDNECLDLRDSADIYYDFTLILDKIWEFLDSKKDDYLEMCTFMWV